MAWFPSSWPNASLERKDAITPSNKIPNLFPRPILTRPLSDFVSAGFARHASSIARCPQNIDNFASTVRNCLVDRISPFLLSHRPTNRRQHLITVAWRAGEFIVVCLPLFLPPPSRILNHWFFSYCPCCSFYSFPKAHSTPPNIVPPSTHTWLVFRMRRAQGGRGWMNILGYYCICF